MTKPRCAAIIVGIDGWEQYTLPLIRSIWEHEPECAMWVVDNASKEPYVKQASVPITRTERLCYSAAINLGKRKFDDVLDGVWGPFDYYIVLSNDVRCTGSFAHMLEQYSDAVVGPQLWHEHGLSWIVGWCVCIPKNVWDAIGGWDEAFQGSSVEDVDLSHSARKKGFELIEDTSLPFVHLDQRQRFNIIPDYWATESHNWAHFRAKHGGA